MTYKNKITVLSAVIAGLAIIYILTIIFDPGRRGARSDAYSWLERSQIDRISGITITRADETITLARNGGIWFVTRDGKDYPARQARVEDFIAALSKRDSYPVRSSSASAHERLSLTPDTAVQVTVLAGAGPPLLTLLIGQSDITGQNVYMRKLDQNEVRSGENRFSAYTGSSLTSWFNLRLFPENEAGKLGAKDIQRLIVYSPKDGASSGASQTFTRSGKGWTFSFELSNPDFNKVETYLQDILSTSGDDFVDGVNPSDPMFNSGRVEMELGNGATKTLKFAAPNEDGKYFTTVSGSDFVYSVQSWAVDKIFVQPDTFRD